MNFSFDRLMGLAERTFNQDPLSGHLFLFVNRDRDRIKILFWDRDGFCIWYKRWSAAFLKCRPATRRAWNSTTNNCRECWAASICAAAAAVGADIVAPWRILAALLFPNRDAFVGLRALWMTLTLFPPISPSANDSCWRPSSVPPS